MTPNDTPLEERKDIIVVRKDDEPQQKRPSDVDDTRKQFMSINTDTQITVPRAIPKDFQVRSAFPQLRPRRLADLPAMTKEYYLFHHGVWFTYGGITYDPLLEFFIRDGEKNKSVFLVPLAERFLHGVARNVSEISAELGLFAIPRDRMRDVLFWMDGTVVADNGVVRWQALRQHIPFNRKGATEFDSKHDTRYLALYGFKARAYSYKWFYYQNGFGCGIQKHVIQTNTISPQPS